MRPEPELTPGVVLPARLPRGFVLDEHMVDGWLRDGGMAAIYRAHRLSDGRRVAVKLQLPSIAHDPSLRERFEREAEVLWRVRGCSHVIELLDVGMLDDGRRYLVMEWVDGEDLEELLDFLRDQDRQLPVARACRIARDVARGLAALHEHGVVHLDLKPSNVMIGHGEDGGDDVVLVDFGIAADLRELEVLEDDPPDEALLGTSGYMSPQRARGRAPSPSCDVYALGVLLFEALSGGCVPPDGWSPETLPRVDALRHGVPPALSELVCLCMSVEAGHRPASANVVAAALDTILRALGKGTAATAGARARLGPGGTLIAPVGGPALRRGNRVGAEAGLIAVEELPPPGLPEGMEAMLRGGPEVDAEAATQPSINPMGAAPMTPPGDTAVGMAFDPDDTEVAMRIASLREEPDDTEPTYELMPVPRQEPDDTEVAMRIAALREEPDDTEPTYELMPVPREEPDDTEATFELAPMRREGPSHGLAPAGRLEAPMRGSRAAAWAEAPAPQLEWLGRAPRWWLPWMIAAGVLAATAGVAARLVDPGSSSKTAASIAVTGASALEPGEARAPSSDRMDEPGTVDEPTQSETAEDSPPPARPEQDPPVEATKRSESVIASKPSSRSFAHDSPERARRGHATAASEATCTEARAQANTAKRTRAWGSVLQATSQRRCWSSAELRVARSRLRVTAYAELGELERCVEEGAKSRDREIAARTALCRKKLGGG